MVAELANPVTDVDAIVIGVFVALVIRPVESILITGTILPFPYHVGVTDVFGNRAAFKVPEDILPAFVVSIVAEEANPVTDEDVIVIGVFVALVIRPVLSTLNDGTVLAFPYHVGTTEVLGRRAAFKDPVVILFAFVVSIVAELASPKTADAEIDMAALVAFVIRPFVSTVNIGTVLTLP